MSTEHSLAPQSVWQHEETLCAFACCRLLDASDREDQGTIYPDPECFVHWRLPAYGLRAQLYQQRMDRYRRS